LEGKGYGLFADVPVSEGDLIGVFTGVLTILTTENESKDHQWKYITEPDAISGESMTLVVDAEKSGNYLRFVNHAADPNTDSIPIAWKNRWSFLYIAKRDIAVGEEITINYGDSFNGAWGEEWVDEDCGEAEVNEAE
jgi:SET domain-containing protein